jgi:hypothetical protein
MLVEWPAMTSECLAIADRARRRSGIF